MEVLFVLTVLLALKSFLKKFQKLKFIIVLTTPNNTEIILKKYLININDLRKYTLCLLFISNRCEKS